MDNRILSFIILGIVLNTVGLIVMVTLANMIVALPILLVGLVFTIIAVSRALKTKK